jgi:peptidylprolyl isomerase
MRRLWSIGALVAATGLMGAAPATVTAAPTGRFVVQVVGPPPSPEILERVGRAAKLDWRVLDEANTLVIDTSKGRIVVEMAPRLAPKAVERVKRLAREGVYDGLLFHRVIEGFVDQTGNPNNHDGGTSAYPDLPAEFSARVDEAALTRVVERADGIEGFVGSVPVAGVSAKEQALGTDHRPRVWGIYCDGVAGMGRQAGVDTANSEIFFMRAPARRLDHDYAVWGRVVQGLEVIRAIKVGEPPADPDRMVRVRLLADMPQAEWPRLVIEKTSGPAFQARAAALKAKLGARFSVCDLTARTLID